jgi:hypothetical protein
MSIALLLHNRIIIELVEQYLQRYAKDIPVLILKIPEEITEDVSLCITEKKLCQPYIGDDLPTKTSFIKNILVIDDSEQPAQWSNVVLLLNAKLNLISCDNICSLNSAYNLDISKRILIHNNTKIPLTEIETNILSKLASGESSKADLLRQIWGYDENINTHTLETHIYRLRSKLQGLPPLISNSNNAYFIHGSGS